MPNRPFRFLHASDLHIDAVPGGLADVPEHVRSLLIDASMRAAEQVFETAEREHVDALLLAGDVVDPASCGPRGLTFLVDRFERLGAAGIRIYWAGSQLDAPDRWPVQIALPENVVHFPSDHVKRIVHERDHEPLFQIAGLSAFHGNVPSAEFQQENAGLYTISMLHGDVDPQSLARLTVNYWALGGKTRRRTLTSSPFVAHYPGTPQARSPKDPGPHGVTMISVDDLGRAKPSFVATDVLRWHEERVVIPDKSPKDTIERMIDERAATLWNGGRGPDQLVRWILAGPHALLSSLRHGKLGTELLSRLRNDYGQKRPMLWSLALEDDRTAPLPDTYYAQQSVLGEFLRTVHEFETTPTEKVSLDHYLPKRHQTGSIAAAVKLDDPELRAEVLRSVAHLGMDLLQGEEIES